MEYILSEEYKRIIHKHVWYKTIRNTSAAFGGAPLGLCFWLFYIINIYGYSLYIPYIFHISFLNMFHIVSLVCFLIYGVKSRSGHDRSQSFGPIWHVSGPEMVFWRNDLMILLFFYHFINSSVLLREFSIFYTWMTMEHI